jgi:hypothetical protein
MTKEHDPFDPANLRVTGTLDEISTERILTSLRVRKPGKQDFVRVHPGDEFKLVCALLTMEGEQDPYLVAPNLANTELANRILVLTDDPMTNEEFADKFCGGQEPIEIPFSNA